MATETLVPDWIKQIEAEQERKQSTAEAKRERELIAGITIQAGAGKFWLQFLKDLKNNTDNLKRIGLHGSLSTYETPCNRCRVSVARESVFPDMTYMDIHFDGAAGIRCLPLQGNPFRLSFRADEGNVAVMANDEYATMDAKVAAELIVKRMTNIVRVTNGR
jgi:hypothetical protein